jgi:hypothetical protein
MKVKGFWHIWMTAHWFTVITDQMRILLTSGLYDECEEINIGCIGSVAERDFLQKYVVDVYPKLKIKYFSERAEDYEFPTLRLIEEEEGHYVGFYFHTKGVTRPFEVVIQVWRNYMNEKILNLWREHYDRVEIEYEVSSMGYLKDPNHFSGNFWWFRRDYIDRCPAIDALDLKNRYHSEQWICMANPKFYSIPHIEPGDAIFPMKYNYETK